MTKTEFLEKLRYELRGLNQRDIDEIIADQEEFIRDAVSAGRSEEEVVSSLGSPKAFADSLKLEYKVNKINSAESTWESYKEVFGSVGILVALAPINLILLIAVIIPIVSFLFSWIVGSGSIVFAGAIMIPITFGASLFVGAGFIPSLALFFTSVSILALGLVGVASFVLFSKLLIKLFITYANWNLEMIKGRGL